MGQQSLPLPPSGSRSEFTGQQHPLPTPPTGPTHYSRMRAAQTDRSSEEGDRGQKRTASGKLYFESLFTLPC